MYDHRHMHRSVAAELARLSAQVDATWEREATILRARGLHGPMSVADVGAGPGLHAERLLEAFPEARVTAVEPDPELRREAELTLEGFDDRVTVTDGALPETGLPSRHFDVAIARFVFQHLDAPAAAAQELRRMLAPGGRVFLIDVDDALGPVIEPPMKGLARAAAELDERQRRGMGDRLIGRKLPSLLLAAGFVDIAVDALVLHSAEVGFAPFLAQLDPDRLTPLIQEQRLRPDALDRLRKEVDAWSADPAATAIQVSLVVSGRRRPRRAS